MPLTAQELDAEVASSPRLYAAAFKSNIDRFKDVGAQNESRNLFYDVKVGELSHDVQSSPRKYASTFRKPSTKSSTVMPLNDLVYDIDHLNKSTIAKRVHGLFFLSAFLQSWCFCQTIIETTPSTSLSPGFPLKSTLSLRRPTT